MILRIISGLEWVQHVMDIMDLAIQCIESLITIVVICMLGHIELMQLDMSKWANPAHTGWLTTSRVENEWT